MSEEIDISPKQDRGILKQILNEGIGESLPPQGSKMKVHYTGTLLDGTKFDSSRDRGEPFEFDLGKGSVIKAWDVGIATMKKGERAMLTCDAKYAYGENGSPPTIPPNSTLKFDVEVLDWIGEDLSPNHDGGIERVEVLIPGEGYTTPNDGAQVEVHIIGKYEGRIFEDRDVSFAIGEGSECNIIEGVEKALEKFKKKESSRLIIKSKYAFGKDGNKEYDIPPNATVEYIVTLNAFEKAKESWSLSLSDKIEQCKIFKEKGTNYFKNGKYNLAIKLYTKIQTFLENEKDPEDGGLDKERQTLLLASYSNIALCDLKIKDYFDAKSQATKALEIEPQNEKALFRRGQALIGLAEPKLASQDFSECLKINPDNKLARCHLVSCNKILKEQLEMEKKIYANMFDKFAKTDTQREENAKEKESNVMSCVGEWGKEDREREPSEFEKENPNILMLNSSGEFKDM